MSPRFPFTALLLALAACGASSPTRASDVAASADVRVSNAHLVPLCVNGSAVKSDQRSWKLSETTALTFTMRNEPRPGIENHAPGLAQIEFTPKDGHSYEIEVRSDAGSFSRRVWMKGEWKPVVRDRTTDRIVSSDPTWIEGGCR